MKTLSNIYFALFFLHLIIGKKLKQLKKYKWLIIISSLNLLLFALIRTDGVHVTSNIGFSVLSELLGFSGSFNRDYEYLYFYISLISLSIQLIIELILLKLSKNNKYKNTLPHNRVSSLRGD